MKKISHELKLIATERIALNTQILTLEAEDISTTAQAGQFVNLTVASYLKRPFGIAKIDPEKGQIQVGIKIVGPSSRELADLSVGTKIEALGPLGKGFILDEFEQGNEIVLIGGGSGIFPLAACLDELATRGISCTVILGFASAADAFFVDRFRASSHRVLLCSDRGDLDFSGNAVEGLRSLEEEFPVLQNASLLACGPTPMLKAIAKHMRNTKRQFQVSLEERMACGLGLCLGCSIPVFKDGKPDYLRCCAEGPVFNGYEIDWGRM